MIANTTYEWTKRKLKAASLIADGVLTVAEIAKKIKVGEATIYRWKNEPEFSEKVQSLVAAIGSRLQQFPLSLRARRVAELQEQYDKLKAVVAARAESSVMQEAAGGNTGLLVRTQKGLGSGLNFTVVDEFTVDTGLLREMREHSKQVAQECGQLVDRTEVTGAGGEPILPLEALVAMLKDNENGDVDGDEQGESGGSSEV